MTGPARPVVIGLGNIYRHDDGVGPAVVEALRHGRPAVDAKLVVTEADVGALIDAWAGRRLVIVVDAAFGGAEPVGSVLRLDAPLHDSGRLRSSTHGFGLADAVALASALGRLPQRLVVLAVVAADVSSGRGLSPAVAASVPGVVDAVRRELGGVS